MQLEILQTERLILKKVTPEDYKHIFANYTIKEAKELLGIDSDEEYFKRKAKSDGGYTSYNRSMVQFLITEKASGKTIGAGGFHNWYPDHKRAEVGYALEKEEYKRKGLMSEALERIIRYGFEEMGLHRIEALVGTQNVPSLKLMEKNGFTREGLLRQHYFINDRYEDSIVFSLLKDELKGATS